MAEAQFPLGMVVMTPGVEKLNLSRYQIFELIQRHVAGDFGDIDEEDTELNRRAIHSGDRILSTYVLLINEVKTRILIITEADRSSTTLLLPSEY